MAFMSVTVETASPFANICWIAPSSKPASRRILTVCSPIIGGPGRLDSGVPLNLTGKYGAMNLPNMGKDDVFFSSNGAASGAARAALTLSLGRAAAEVHSGVSEMGGEAGAVEEVQRSFQ